MVVGGLVGNLAESLGVVSAEAGLGVVADLGGGVVLGRGLRAILEIDRVCRVRVPEVSVDDRWVRILGGRREEAPREKMCPSEN